MANQCSGGSDCVSTAETSINEPTPTLRAMHAQDFRWISETLQRLYINFFRDLEGILFQLKYCILYVVVTFWSEWTQNKFEKSNAVLRVLMTVWRRGQYRVHLGMCQDLCCATKISFESATGTHSSSNWNEIGQQYGARVAIANIKTFLPVVLEKYSVLVAVWSP